jgi:transposase-like protein
MKTSKFNPELRERAVRMVLEHRADLEPCDLNPALPTSVT